MMTAGEFLRNQRMGLTKILLNK